MSIGLVCHFLEQDLSGKLINTLFEKGLQLNQFNNKKYTNDFILSTYLSNLDNLKNLINKIINIGFKSYRMSSGILPLFDKVDENISNHSKVVEKLKIIGNIIKTNNLRVSFHPDHFVVLSSEKENVIENSIKDLSYHAWIMDKMELDESTFYSINIHATGKGKQENVINSIKKLPNNIRKRLTLENDELCSSVKTLYDIYSKTGVPICFDSHHHVFNTSDLSMEEASEMAISTWGNVKPIQHLSNTDPIHDSGNFQNRRKHSDFVHYIPGFQKKLLLTNKADIDFEFKMKNIAIIDSLKKFDISL
jgi:UV DNA damage endonuclease